MGVYITEYSKVTDQLIREVRIDHHFTEKEVIKLMGFEDEEIYDAYELGPEKASYFKSLGVEFNFIDNEYFIQSFSDI